MKTLIKVWFPALRVLLVALLAVMFGGLAKAQDAASQPSWTDLGIGAAGSFQEDANGVWAVTDTGVDIGGNRDAFHYVYQVLNGDGQITARVLGIGGTNTLAKAGVMLRETLGADARNTLMELSLNRGLICQWRSVAGDVTRQSQGSTNVTAPVWVRLVRHGDWVGGYSSPDGINWTLSGWENLSGLAAQVYVGLAVTSHSSLGIPTTAWFDQVNVGADDSSEILNPVIGSGDGLAGSYFSNRHLFGNAAASRVDASIDFDFRELNQASFTGTNSYLDECQKLLGISKGDEFGVRWSGELQSQFTEPYTLYAQGVDGVRVWLNEQLVIDDWAVHSKGEDVATVNLVAGQHYLLRVEYFKNHGNARMRLSWSSPSTPKRVIPQSQMYSQVTDTDGNGLPDLWEQHYFGQIGADSQADPDTDGQSNLQEYQSHTDPTNLLNWGLPNQWGHGDIESGAPSDASDGTAGYSNGVFTVSSMGRDIWLRGDNFHYVFQSVGTNGEMVARYLGGSGTNLLAKAGLMVRETLDNDARNVTMAVEQDNFLLFQSRTATGDKTMRDLLRTNQLSYGWLKLVRNNDWVGGYVSADGTNWVLFDWEILKGLSTQAYVGLAITAHSHKGTRSPSTAQFDQVSVGPASATDALNPVVGNGDGLSGGYRNDSLLYLPGLTNVVDGQLDFNWVHNTPFKNLNPDSYGVCWSGELQAQFTEPYTLTLQCRQEDWVRVWINEKLVIDGWRKLHPDTAFDGTYNLVAGQHYLIRVEMFNNHGKGSARLKWSSPSTPKRFIPQTQLYSHPVDTDGHGLPDLWQKIYFGHLGVDPNADPDGDGLSNLQEFRNHTNPLQADTDADGIPDAWEIAHGLDPQFNDAGLDYDNSGWNNLQKYQYGLNPLNLDGNGDGLPDIFEEVYLGANLTNASAGLATTVVIVNGAQATNYLGGWQVDGTDIYCLDRRGGVDFNLTVSNADVYVLNLVGTQNQRNQFAMQFKLLLSIDGQTLGHYTLTAGYGTNGEVALVLPYVKAGTHTLHLFWDGVASFSSLRIKQVKLLSVAGADANHNGIKDWAERLMKDESGLELTNAVIASYTSPVCLEGRDPYPALTVLTNNLTNALVARTTSDGRWYVNAPLQTGTQTVFQASYQNGGLTETRRLQWLTVNVLQMTNSLVIRKGDSLLFNALPASGQNGNLQITIGTNLYTGKTAKGIACKFSTAGLFTVTGTYVATSGSTQSGSVVVDVVEQNLPNVSPAAWTWMQRNLNLSSLAPEAGLQADSRMTCVIAGTNANGGVRLNLGVFDNESRSIIARLGTNGPVLDATTVSGFDIWSGNQAYTKCLQTYSDGSQLIEMLVISSPVETNVTLVLEPIVSGVIFDDGTTLRTLTATNFDALGQCPVRFIRPATTHTSVCNSIRAYQGNYQIGYRH